MLCVAHLRSEIRSTSSGKLKFLLKAKHGEGLCPARACCVDAVLHPRSRPLLWGFRRFGRSGSQLLGRLLCAAIACRLLLCFRGNWRSAPSLTLSVWLARSLIGDRKKSLVVTAAWSK